MTARADSGYRTQGVSRDSMQWDDEKRSQLRKCDMVD